MTLLTVAEAQPLIKYKRAASIYDDIKKGVFPPGVVIRINRRVRFHQEALLEWLAKGGTLAEKTRRRNQNRACRQ